MTLVGANSAKLREYLPVPIAYLHTQHLPFDLYIRQNQGWAPALYRSAGLPFLQEHRDRLDDQNVAHLYVPANQSAALTRIISANIANIQADKTLTDQLKREAIGGVCTRLMDDVMASAGGDSMNSLMDLGHSIATTPTPEDPGFLQCLLDMSGHDFGTSVHMMNVGIGCGLLAKKLHPDEPEFISAVVKGGFVHDLGKASVPTSILNKNGRLTDEEFAVIKAHPAEGVRMLESLGVDDTVMLETARDHHEHLAGTGYPSGKTAEDLGLAARIAAVVDVYDALTAARPYRAPIAWDDALGMLDEHRGAQFDPVVLDAWADIVQKAAVRHEDDLPEETAEPGALGDELMLDEASAVALGASESTPSAGPGQPSRLNCRLRASVVPATARPGLSGEPATVSELSDADIVFTCRAQHGPGAILRLMTKNTRNEPVAMIVVVTHAQRAKHAGEGWRHTATVRCRVAPGEEQAA
jgi:HD-GYP domain-containing protein (c-di-GMP phosphodiesterase class II)